MPILRQQYPWWHFVPNKAQISVMNMASFWEMIVIYIFPSGCMA